MGVAALLGGLVLIIVILGFVTALQNRFAKPRGRGRNSADFAEENDQPFEGRHSPRHYKKGAATRSHRQTSSGESLHHHEHREHREHREHEEAHHQVSPHTRDRGRERD